MCVVRHGTAALAAAHHVFAVKHGFAVASA